MVCGQDLLIGLHYCLIEVMMLHIPVVHEEKLFSICFLGELRLAGKSGDLNNACISTYLDKVLQDLFSKNATDTFQVVRGGQLKDLGIVMDQLELNIRIGKRHMIEFIDDMAQLCLVGF